jgi:hypothetical protein
VQHPQKIAPQEAMKAWARELAKEGVAVEWQKLLPHMGFRILARVGGAAYFLLARTEPADQQRLRKAV